MTDNVYDILEGLIIDQKSSVCQQTHQSVSYVPDTNLGSEDGAKHER